MSSTNDIRKMVSEEENVSKIEVTSKKVVSKNKDEIFQTFINRAMNSTDVSKVEGTFKGGVYLLDDSRNSF